MYCNWPLIWPKCTCTVCWKMFVMKYFCELYTTRENKNHEDMGVVASKHHVDSWIDGGVIVSLLQARFCCSKPTRSIIFKCPFFCHWFMANNSHWATDHCYIIGISIISSLSRTSQYFTPYWIRNPDVFVDMVTPHTAFTNELLCHFHTLSKQIIHVVLQGFYLLKLEVGGEIVVIRENLNLRTLQNRPFYRHMVYYQYHSYYC